MDAPKYKEYSDKKAPRSPVIKNCIKAFLVGGAICTFGEFLSQIYQGLGMGREEAGSLVSVSLIFLSMLFTGLGLYSKLAKHAGAGTLVPITGFANAVASSAIEAKSEGLIMGVGAKLFTIAGPVIVYGICASAVAGLISYIFMM
ncbi:MAG: stage V sporulation protein AC [Eubacteriales bacterium]|nr:stage V sporulation protein AC [Eubacteriales bacterium]